MLSDPNTTQRPEEEGDNSEEDREARRLGRIHAAHTYHALLETLKRLDIRAYIRFKERRGQPTQTFADVNQQKPQKDNPNE